MIRAFVAIRPPEPVIDRLALAQAGAPGRRVARENLHLTLAFLGETPADRLSDADAALAAIAAGGFALTLDGLGLFGGAKPRQIFARVARSDRLSRLQSKVEQAARGAGIALEGGRYTPHVTLARLDRRGGAARAAERFVASRAMFLAGPFEVGDFRLYRSTLGHGGPVYEEIARYRLTAGAAAVAAGEG